MKKNIVIDLFCGAGGESQGIHDAFTSRGMDIKLYAVNHWQVACNTHATNFPSDECICQDIQTVIPTDLVAPNEDVELLWASPECTNFSVAKGGRPLDDQSRCTPFDIVRWLTMLRVKRVIIENVPEFLTWGPLTKAGRPDQRYKGQFFMWFINSLKSLGYIVDWKVCCAADYGAPTTRSRLFIQAVKKGSGKKLVWPHPTHSQTGHEDMFGSLQKWIPAREIIDFSIPSTPIEKRKRPLCRNTMKRIENGIRAFWKDEAVPFLVRYNGGENRYHSLEEPMPVLDCSNRYGLVEPLLMEYYGNGTCRPVSEPLGTVTTKERFALLEPNLENFSIGFRMLTPKELAAAQSFPSGYRFTGCKTDVVKQIGNAVCPKMAEALVANA